MKVKDMIEMLKEVDGELDVIIEYEDGSGNIDYFEADGFQVFDQEEELRKFYGLKKNFLKLTSDLNNVYDRYWDHGKKEDES